MKRPYRVTPVGGRARTFRRQADALAEAFLLARGGGGPARIEKHGEPGTVVVSVSAFDDELHTTNYGAHWAQDHEHGARDAR